MSAALLYRQHGLLDSSPVIIAPPVKKPKKKAVKKRKPGKLIPSDRNSQVVNVSEPLADKENTMNTTSNSCNNQSLTSPSNSSSTTDPSESPNQSTLKLVLSSHIPTEECLDKTDSFAESSLCTSHSAGGISGTQAAPATVAVTRDPPLNSHVISPSTNKGAGAVQASEGSANEGAVDIPRDSSQSLEDNYGPSTQEVEDLKQVVVNPLSCSVTCAELSTESPSKPATKKLKRKKKSEDVAPYKLKKQKKERTVVDQDAVLLIDQVEFPMTSSGKQRATSSNGKDEARQLFEWLINPVKPEQFFKELWEKKPLLIKRHNTLYNEGWFSSSDLSDILEKSPVQFGTHLDLTSYREGKRETHNKPGRAFPHVVWKHFKEGGSIRMLNPQTYSEPVWRLLNTLQDYFRSSMGANVYLTPPGTQGFAPHYDDIDAFLIQLEGRKHWRLYAPRTEEETLPRHSSGNFTQVELGKVILDTVLEAGDMLYFPRGTVHQGNCLPDTHSLHITVSTYQLNTWGDLLERLLPKALTIAQQEDIEYRKGLPRDYLDYTGVSKSDMGSKQRDPFIKKVCSMLTKLAQYAPVDAAADDLGARLLHDALPPNPSRSCTASTRTSARCSQGDVTLPSKITSSSRVRLVTPYAARLFAHEDCVSVQHSASNSRLFHEVEPQEIDYPSDYGPALELLTNSYPSYVDIKALPLEPATAVKLTQELVEMGILQVKQGSGIRSGTASVIREIKAKVSRPPPKIKSRDKNGSVAPNGTSFITEEEMAVQMRNGRDRKRPTSRPSSEILDISNKDTRVFRRTGSLNK